MDNADKVFELYRWGKCYYSGLINFVPFPGQKQIRDLEVNESTEGRFTNPTSDKAPERITRVA